MSRKRILLVEDNLTTSKTLVLFLSESGYEVVCAYDGTSGLLRFQQARFDLVVLDLMLPDLDGRTICRTIKSKHSTPIIMLTAKSTEDDIVAGLESGADDYVCKPFGSKELLARIRRCLRPADTSTSDQGLLTIGDIVVDTPRRTVTVGGGVVRLTKSEYAILMVMLKRSGRVLTRAQLIDAALGTDFNGFDRTIDTHIWSLRKKLGEPSGHPRYIHSEPGIGYRLEDRHAG